MINQILKPKIFNRKRINMMLNQIFEVPIFFISASMGYGKTTSVKNFLEKNKEIQTIWFDANYEENDDIWIWHKFCNSIKNTNFKLSERFSAYGLPKNDIDNYEIMEIIRDEIEQKTVIVIDDWYDKRTTCIKSLIKAIALEEIPNLYIVIISRNRPSDEYIELELKQKCMVMWQEDIAFTFNETVEFFEINGVILKEKEKKEVYEYTGGWASATYLALLQYYEKNYFDNIPKATELIKTTVYDRFDETTKEIILKLSLVENFTLDQAIYITENKNCSLVIKNLISSNCFIKYNREAKIYTLHSILRSALKEELLLLNIDLTKINNVCGDWYSKNYKDADAMEYYYKAKNYTRIFDLIEKNNTIDLTNLWGKIINPVFNEVSMEQKVNRPIAYLTYIFFYILYRNAIVGKELLYELWVIYEVNDDLKDRNQVLGEIAFLESILMIDDVKKMCEYHKKAYEFFKGGTSKIANYKMPITFGSPHFLCLFHRKKGELKALIKLFEKESHYFIHISNGGATGVNYLMLGEYFFETGDALNGELFAYKAFYKAKSKEQTSILICSLFLLIRIHLYKNNRVEFQNKFNSLINIGENLNIPRFLNGTEIALAYINGITGNFKDIDNWACDLEMYNMQIISPRAKMSYIIYGLKMIHKESYIELEIQAETMLEIYAKGNNIFGTIYAYIFNSIAKYKLYGMEEAKKSLLKAIDLAEGDELIMCFVELGPHILPIIEELQEENEYAKVLLPDCKKYNEMYEKNYCNIEKVELTSRELEIMKLVNEGYKQSEISEKLNIALITVKKHISSVYFKLNVKNKTVAINLLKEKGII